MKNLQEMRKIIQYFTIKYHGEWEEIYEAIRAKENIRAMELETIEQNSKSLQYMSIVDDNYPNNFKSIYMPPLSLFIFGNGDFLNQDEKIISLWGQYDIKLLQDLEINQSNIYAIEYKINNLENIKRLVESGFKLILIDEDKPNDEKIQFLKTLNNVCYISEFPLYKREKRSSQQTGERLLLGISYKSLLINPNPQQYKDYCSICEFEKRNKNFYLLDNKKLEIECLGNNIRNFLEIL